jgi:hypothetical protein
VGNRRVKNAQTLDCQADNRAFGRLKEVNLKIRKNEKFNN